MLVAVKLVIEFIAFGNAVIELLRDNNKKKDKNDRPQTI
jgi:hypothetical protein